MGSHTMKGNDWEISREIYIEDTDCTLIKHQIPVFYHDKTLCPSVRETAQN